ncbi:MAG: insulinase family protein [Tannerella sp.]|jgi:zinc protease|nr:insulinase family protein [Tannerella sp.]
MRKIFFIAALTASVTVTVFSQNKQENGQAQDMMFEKLVLDPELRYGKLDNGLTYYIRHNEMPKERAEFYIVNNVGSMQEEESQRGLAHFLEHMAFNGSKNFPSKTGIQDYTENIGMRFGENLNAYTGFDETVYMLMNVPVTSEGVIDSCLLILHDWSSFLLLEDEAIEKERGVIREEWRTGRTAQMRLWEQQLPKMYLGSKYGRRLPIGNINVIDHFVGGELRDYYRKWYRPDLQAVIIVGDIDVDKIEAKLKSVCSDMPAAANRAPKEAADVPDNKIPLISIAKDKEMTNTVLSVYFKHDNTPEQLKGTILDFVTGYSQTVVSLIMGERFAEILQKPDPPFIAAQTNDGDYFVSRTKGAWTAMAVAGEGDTDRAMKALILETKRVMRYGFTEAEYDRARTNILKAYETAYKERDKHQNSSYAEEYITHFTQGDCTPGLEAEYKIIQQIAPGFPLEGINQFVRNLFGDKEVGYNVVISLICPDKEGIATPTEEDLLEMFLDACKQSVTANANEKISDILIEKLPEPGRIVGERTDTLFGTTVYELSNGARVVLKISDLKKDEILMKATSPGGTTMFKDEKDIWNLQVINNSMSLGGLGQFSETNLAKALAGKNVSHKVTLGSSSENVSGSASPSDLKTLFELVYLIFTEMRVDDGAYASFESRVKAQYENFRLNPWTAFSDTLSDIVYDYNPRNRRFVPKDFEKVDYHRTIDMYNERFGDASDFVFTFIGNIETDSIRPLIERYIASLPSTGRKEKGDESQITPFRRGTAVRHFTREMEVPKSTVGLCYGGKMEYSLRSIVIGHLLNEILDLVYTEKVREDESASYGVQSTVAVYDFPEGRTSIQIFFDTDPEKVDRILGIVKNELEKIAAEGPRETDLTKSRANILKGRNEIKQENNYWLSIIDAYYFRGFDGHTEYDGIISGITPDDIRAFVKEFLDQGNLVEVVMSPEAAAK